jgi:hypothetical protein
MQLQQLGFNELIMRHATRPRDSNRARAQRQACPFITLMKSSLFCILNLRVVTIIRAADLNPTHPCTRARGRGAGAGAGAGAGDSSSAREGVSEMMARPQASVGQKATEIEAARRAVDRLPGKGES